MANFCSDNFNLLFDFFRLPWFLSILFFSSTTDIFRDTFTLILLKEIIEQILSNMTLKSPYLIFIFYFICLHRSLVESTVFHFVSTHQFLTTFDLLFTSYVFTYFLSIHILSYLLLIYLATLPIYFTYLLYLFTYLLIYLFTLLIYLFTYLLISLFTY